MKYFLRRLALFFCYFFILYSALLFIWDSIFIPHPYQNLNYKIGAVGHMYSRIKEIKNFHNVDLLFLGSSHTYRGFDTRLFKKSGLYTFNLGSSAQTPIETEILVDKYLDDLNPHMVIYEVYPNTFEMDGVESALDLVSNDQLDFYTLELAFEINNIIVYNTLIYRIVRNLLFLDKGFIESPKKEFDTYISGGFVEREITEFKNEKRYQPQKWELQQYNKDAFERTVKKLKDRNIKVILVQTPITIELYQSYTNHAEIDHYFKSIATYYNYNEYLKLPGDKYFMDPNHLNQSGVEIFNEMLIDTLTTSGILSYSYEAENKSSND